MEGTDQSGTNKINNLWSTLCLLFLVWSVNKQMTLILSCLTQEYAIQVSDKRITRLADCSVIDEARNKGVQFCNQMVFGYSGPATIGNQNTDVWLTETLSERSSLEDGLSLAMQQLTEMDLRKRLAFVGAGWAQFGETDEVSPLRITLSNALKPEGVWLPEPQSAFELDGITLKPTTKFDLISIGAHVSPEAMTDAKLAVKGIVDHSVSPIAIVKVLAETIRRVARHDNTVGETLLGMIAPKIGARSNTTGIRERSAITEPIHLPVFMHIPAHRFDLDRTFPNFVCDGFTSTESKVFFANPPTRDSQ